MGEETVAVSRFGGESGVTSGFRSSGESSAGEEDE